MCIRTKEDNKATNDKLGVRKSSFVRQKSKSKTLLWEKKYKICECINDKSEKQK